MVVQWNKLMLLFLLLNVEVNCKPAATTRRKRPRLATHSTYASSFYGLSSDPLMSPTIEGSNTQDSDSTRAFTVTKAEYLRAEWCKTEPLKQIIREKGCLKRKIMNQFCYGQCNSFFIPQSEGAEQNEAFVSCAFCKPRKFSWITITLRCPGKRPRFQRKRIQRVQKCRCMPQELN